MRALLTSSAIALVASVGPALAFDACPDDSTYRTLASEHGVLYTTTFDNLQVGPGDAGTCNFSVQLENGAAKGTISVFSADYSGGYVLGDGDHAELKVTHNGTTETIAIDGPLDEPSSNSRHVGVIASIDGKLLTKAEVDMSDADNSPDIEFNTGSLDAVDYTEIGRITLPTDESSIIAHLGGSATLLTSAQPISEDNSISFFGGLGSAMLGANGQFNLGQGFSLLGGAALIEQGYSTVGVQGVIGSLAVRYVEPGLSTFRPFAEGGATLGGLGLTFTDPGKTTTTAGLASVYARGGVETALDSQTTATLSASLEESLLGVGGYDLSTKSFSATLAGQSGRFTVAKAEASIHHQFTDTIDASASAGVGVLFAHDVVTANIGGLGNVTQAPPSQLFVDYGARLGWAFAPSSKLEGFVQGSTTTDLGTHVQVGAAFTQKF